MNVIEVVLTGIIYLLGPGNDKTIRAIVPNAGMPSAPYGQIITDHYPYVKVRTADVEGKFWEATSGRMPDFVFTKEPGAPEYAIYFLNGDTITIVGQDLGPKPLAVCLAADCGKKLNGAPKSSYQNVPSIREACPTCGALNPAYLNASDHSLVAAVIELDAGTMSAANVDTMTKWTFEPLVHKKGKPVKKDLLADQAVLKIDSAKTVRLRFTDHKGNVFELPLIDEAEVEIGNQMPNDVLPMKLQHDPEAVDPHFGLYYRMLTTPVPHDPPLPHRTVPANSDDAGFRQNCIPVRG
jgi:hypothetical protein